MDRHLRRHSRGEGRLSLSAPSAGPPPGRRGYTVGASLSWGVRTFQAHSVPLALIALALLGVGVLVNLAGYPLRAAVAPPLDSSGRVQPGGLFGLSVAVTMLVLAVMVAAALVVQAALVNAALKLTRSEQVTFSSSFSGLDMRAVVLTALLVGAIVFVGLLLCLVPALIGLFLTSYALFFVVDQGLPPAQAVRASVQMCTRSPGPLGGMFLASLAVAGLGLCLCGVGLLVALPVVVLAQAYTYGVFTGDPV